MLPLTFLETLLDWKVAVDGGLVAVVGLWALLWSGGMVLALLQRSRALQWAVAAATVGASSLISVTKSLQLLFTCLPACPTT